METVEEAKTLGVVVTFIEPFKNVRVGEGNGIRSSVELVKKWTRIGIAVIG